MAFLFYFERMNQIWYNGKFYSADDPVFPASNKSYRYGDGLFETIRTKNGKAILSQFHFERLFSSLETLKISLPSLFSKNSLENDIARLCQKNNCLETARVRLSVCRGNGGLYDGDNKFQYLIECWPLENASDRLNENGLIIDVFPDARKSTDKFSNLKSANFLAYAMAAIWAKENKLNDALILNTHERISDATIANIFWLKDGIIFTPSLSEGCVAGVMRRFLMENLLLSAYQVFEKELAVAELEQADEVFLTNAVYGIKWVQQFRGGKYPLKITSEIFSKLIKPLF